MCRNWDVPTLRYRKVLWIHLLSTLDSTCFITIIASSSKDGEVPKYVGIVVLVATQVRAPRAADRTASLRYSYCELYSCRDAILVYRNLCLYVHVHTRLHFIRYMLLAHAIAVVHFPTFALHRYLSKFLSQKIAPTRALNHTPHVPTSENFPFTALHRWHVNKQPTTMSAAALDIERWRASQVVLLDIGKSHLHSRVFASNTLRMGREP